jgi:hypothetical protein
MKKRRPAIPRNLRPRNPDAAVFSMLRRFGKNVAGLEKVDFYLYFSDQSNAELARKALLASGFSVGLNRSSSDSRWLCLATKKMTRKVESLVSMRMDLVELARRFHGEYDGWETQIT